MKKFCPVCGTERETESDRKRGDIKYKMRRDKNRIKNKNIYGM
ncbi:MAG: hypothetical protein PWQ68_1496 [Thermoanaerobacteraceae bacterium]|jgi:uncharacterized Zn finger protein (UPF0148 family)|nr:hypothetical protein [Thermoanaerobacteraceae bacterium]